MIASARSGLAWDESASDGLETGCSDEWERELIMRKIGEESADYCFALVMELLYVAHDRRTLRGEWLQHFRTIQSEEAPLRLP
jgi:hypothetical protein